MGFFSFLGGDPQKKCNHRWHPVSVKHYHDISYGRPGAQSTTVTSRCVICGTVDTKHLYGSGFLELAELQKIPLVKRTENG